MTFKKYYTRLKYNTVAADKYVQGVIMGMMRCLCTVGEDGYETFDKNICILKDKKTGDYIYGAVTTWERYCNFRAAVEKFYPDTCEFDIFD